MSEYYAIAWAKRKRQTEELTKRVQELEAQVSKLQLENERLRNMLKNSGKAET